MQKKKICRCGKEFAQFLSTEKSCSLKCELKRRDEATKKKTAKAVKKASGKVASEREYKRPSATQEAQIYFNKSIKARDIYQPCISCGRPWDVNFEAGHLFSVGAHAQLRFNELNVNGQCWHCNNALNGNKKGYIKGLSKKISVKESDITPILLAEMFCENQGLRPKEIIKKYRSK